MSGNVIKVYYVKNVFTLTIHYRYAEGGVAVPDHVENDLVQGMAYNVTSPAIPGYTVDKATVSGSMPAQDVTETVTLPDLAIFPTVIAAPVELDADKPLQEAV